MRRGIILAGGNGTRLNPLTSVASKQLLPVYDRPMVFYSIERMIEIGVTDILCIVAPRDYEIFKRVLGNRVNFAIQKEPRGIAESILIADTKDPVILWLGDNLVIGKEVGKNLKKADRNFDGATVFLHENDNPSAYGVAEINGGKIIGIEEKPSNPRSNKIITGIYFYDGTALERVKKQKPSARGELEITDLNKSYLIDCKLNYLDFGKNAEWFDMGTFDDLLRASVRCSQIASNG
jgi:glucose-1-phosphate thymidylyltransferase